MAKRVRKGKPICDELRRIEEDMLEQLISLYYSGTSFETFWEMVERIDVFVDLRRKVCPED